MFGVVNVGVKASTPRRAQLRKEILRFGERHIYGSLQIRRATLAQAQRMPRDPVLMVGKAQSFEVNLAKRSSLKPHSTSYKN